MPRNLAKFNKKYAVIGCGHNHGHCSEKGQLHPEEDYYSIDIQQHLQPDFVFDVTTTLPQDLYQRFEIVFLENLDWYAYNLAPEYLSKLKLPEIERNGFENIYDMTRDDGFIVISGCPRLKPFRNSIKELKYVEITRDPCPNKMEVVIIPKNQTIPEEEIDHYIRSNPEIVRLIEALNKINYFPQGIHKFKYCEKNYEEFGRGFIGDELLSVNQPQIVLNQKIPQIANVYKKLFDLTVFCQNNPRYGNLRGAVVMPLAFACNVNTPPSNMKNINHLNLLELFSDELQRQIDNFFQNPEDIIKRDIHIFQEKISLLLAKYKRKFAIQDNNAGGLFGAVTNFFSTPTLNFYVSALEAAVADLTNLSRHNQPDFEELTDYGCTIS
ncbi:hypothetical protein ACFORL_04165 [Legionella dresdenensis]|uniref:Uncharacterized protein n=1 Tax=Legionella dresdenensis TaxID=450200 RepID=A0ABV8CE04_9GAMM